MVGGLATLAGFIGPDKWLDRKIAKRQEAIGRSLPDTLDLITAGSEAGLSFDAAVQRIVARTGQADQELRAEFARYLADVGLGQSRSDALADLACRCGVDDMKAIVAALLQADQLGVGVGSVLRVQSSGLRTRRRQRAQEEAMKAPIKMLFPMVFFIFPAIFVIILGPAGIQIMDQFLKR
ncbi:MAG: type II secretion system F family protein, partial [Bacteroidota bacterium]